MILVHVPDSTVGPMSDTAVTNTAAGEAEIVKVEAEAKSIYAALNTHMIGGVGLGTGIISILAIVLQPALDHFLPAHNLGALVPIVDFYAQSMAAPVMATALGAAYFGRPKSV